MDIDVKTSYGKYKDMQIGDTFQFVDKIRKLYLKCYDGYVNLTDLVTICYAQLNGDAMEALAEEDIIIIPTKLVNR